MKILSIFLLYLFLFSCTNKTLESNYSLIMKQKYEKIRIDSMCMAINRQILFFDSFESDSFQNTSEGGQTTYYYDSTEIKKIIIISYGDLGKSRNVYYFHNNCLFYSVQLLAQYSAPISSMESITISKKFVNEYYFSDSNNLERMIINSDFVSPKDTNYKAIEDNIILKMKHLRQRFDRVMSQ